MADAVDKTYNEAEKITTWLPPTMVTLCDTNMRMTCVDGAFQLYGHPKEAMQKIRSVLPGLVNTGIELRSLK